MSPAVAVTVILVVAVVVLYLGLAAVLREVRMLRAQVTRMAAVTAVTDVTDHDAQPGPRISMPAVVRDGQPAVVLAADSSCPLCRMTIGRLAELAERMPEPPVLLTYESPEQWGPLPPRLRVVRDDDAWSQVAHLTPPVLLKVDGQGRVLDLALPSREDDVDDTLTSWGVPLTPPTRK